MKARTDAIISIYSKDLKLIKDKPSNKNSSNGIGGFNNIYCHVAGGKLYAVTNEKNRLGY